MNITPYKIMTTCIAQCVIMYIRSHSNDGKPHNDVLTKPHLWLYIVCSQLGKAHIVHALVSYVPLIDFPREIAIGSLPRKGKVKIFFTCLRYSSYRAFQ